MSTDGADTITVFPARRVLTMEPGNPVATAVAVRGRRIIEAGSVESMKPWLDAHPHVIDEQFADKVILPGFIDPHLHPMLAAALLSCHIVSPEGWNLPDGDIAPCPNRVALQDRLAKYVRESEGPIVTWGYHKLWHGEMTRSDIDQIAGDRPLVLWSRSAHEFILGSAALSWLDLDRAAAEAESGGQADWDQGHFYESGTIPVQMRLMRHFTTPEKLRSGLAKTASLVHSGGVTTCGDLAAGGWRGIEAEMEILTEAYENDNTPFRTFLVPSVLHLMKYFGDNLEATAERIKTLPQLNTRRLQWLKAVKTFADGAFFTQAMHLCEPGYIDGHHGEWITEPEEMLRLSRPFWEKDYDIYVHANGDRGIDASLEVLAQLATARPRAEFRYDLQHFGISREDQVTRAARLGASVSANGYYVHLLSDAYAEHGIGTERAEQITRLGSLGRQGVPFSLHSDLPMGPVQPLLAVSAAATRRAPSGVVRGDCQRISVEQALRAVTIDAAWTLHKDHELGSIAAGKLADLVVLDSNPFDVDPADIKNIGIHATVFEGSVHQLPSTSEPQ